MRVYEASRSTVVLAAWILSIALCAPLPASEPPRIALVIGNAQYQKSPSLRNPGNDAVDIAGKLRTLGFQLVGDGPHLNIGRTEMARLLRDFGNATHDGDTALFYYAGHGIAFDGENWLLPVDDREIDAQEDVPDFALSRPEVSCRAWNSAGEARTS